MSVDVAVSDYERIGGAAAVRTAVHRFYRLVLDDPQLAPYFERVDVAVVKRHQAALLSELLGGPRRYTGRDLAQAHRHLEVPGAHFDRVALYLTGTLWELGADVEVLVRVGEALAAVRPTIVREVPAAAGRDTGGDGGARGAGGDAGRAGEEPAARRTPADRRGRLLGAVLAGGRLVAAALRARRR
jgi:hemoglobin